MHISGISLDLYWLLQFVFTALLVALGLRYLVKSTASKYFVVDSNFEGGGDTIKSRRRSRDGNIGFTGGADGCAFCGNSANKKCSGCKAVRYCSELCQSKHWKDHKLKCKEFKIYGTLNSTPSFNGRAGKASICSGKSSTELQQSKKVLFPYEEFVKLFNWDKQGFPPCGLLNCGNSCFANVVLQCLFCTRPLVAYLLEKVHRRECRRNDWCFLCELQVHVERTRHCLQPFSPINILSRLPHIGNLGYGKQEDAHEFMRFAIDTMQSICLDGFGGEITIHPSSQETTIIQYMFGGHLRSQVTCAKCNKISYRYEKMMDLTVEIQGDAASLEDCLDLFTAKEWLDGENMYKCDGCNDYVKACKRLTIHQAPNILTIALKRFQCGRFGKLNKRVTFPETLDLGPYMSESRDDTDLYRLYAVVVHVDMLNASFFGHYICYAKDFCGNWYMIDDCEVTTVELEEVLGQEAYMLLYCRACVRPPWGKPLETSREVHQEEVVKEEQPCLQPPVESIIITGSIDSVVTRRKMPSNINISSHTEESGPKKEDPADMDLDDPIKVNSRFTVEDPLDMDLDNPIKVNSKSQDPLDMELDGINVNLRCAREGPHDPYLSNPGSSSLDAKDLGDFVSKRSHAAENSSSADIVDSGVSFSVPFE